MTRIRSHLTMIVLGLLAGTSLLMACAGTVVTPPSNGAPSTSPTVAATTAAEPGKPVVIVLPADIQSLDKSAVNLYNDANVSNNIFDRLLQFDGSFNIQPMLATGYKLIDDNTWEFQLRQDAKFHDGTPFTARAVKATIDYSKREDARVATLLKGITDVEIVDDYTVRLHTDVPNAILPNTFAWLDMYPEHVASLEAFGENPIGTGPFRFKEWTRGQQVTLTANPDYWGGAPQIPEVVFRFVTEPSTRVAMLTGGEADLITNLNPENVETIEAGTDTKVAHNLGLRKMVLVISNLVEPLQDVKVRQALNYAIDRESLIKNLYLGYAVKSLGMTQTTIPAHLSELDNAYDYDPEKAKSLLAEAGYPDGFEITLITPSGTFPKDKEAAQAIADQLSKVGIKANINTMEFGAMFSLLHSMKMEGLLQTRFGNTAGDPSEQYTYNYWSKGVRHYVTDPKVDELFEQAQQTMDAEKRLDMFRELEKYTIEDVVPWVWLYDLENIYGVSQRLNWEPKTPEETIDLRGATVTQVR